MKLLLKVLFTGIFIWMIAMTVNICLHKPLWQAGAEFSWKSSPWAVATLFDAYFGFLTFFVWVCYKEQSFYGRVLWFLLIMTLGNIAMSGYILLQLQKMNSQEPLSNLLLRRNP